MDLKIALLPLDIAQGDKDANLSALASGVSELPPGTDLLVLPELFSTGFVNDSGIMMRLAEPVSGKTVEILRKTAASAGIAIAGSFLCLVGNRMTNRGFFIEPSGDETWYDKRHLFCGSPESNMLARGEKESKVVRYRGWNIVLEICYDIRFPVWCRNKGGRYDLMIVPANWPAAREYDWRHLLIARAIENRTYVVGANRSGSDSFGVYDNLSFIFDPLGRPVEGKGSGKLLLAELSKEKTDDIRAKMPVLNDADDFIIR